MKTLLEFLMLLLLTSCANIECPTESRVLLDFNDSIENDGLTCTDVTESIVQPYEDYKQAIVFCGSCVASYGAAEDCVFYLRYEEDETGECQFTEYRNGTIYKIAPK